MSTTHEYVITNNTTTDGAYYIDDATANGPFYDVVNDIHWYDSKDLDFTNIYYPQIPLHVTKTNIGSWVKGIYEEKEFFEQGQPMVEWGNVEEALKEWIEKLFKEAAKERCDIDLSVLDDI